MKHHLFYDDGRGEPIKGGPAPDVAFTISQTNRLGIETKRLAKFTSSQEPRPFLSVPIEPLMKVAAFRGNLLATVAKKCVLDTELIEYLRRSYSRISRMQYYVGI